MTPDDGLHCEVSIFLWNNDPVSVIVGLKMCLVVITYILCSLWYFAANFFIIIIAGFMLK